MKDVGPHGAEEILARGHRGRRAPHDDRQLARGGALGASADGSVDHGDAPGRELIGEPARHDRVDGAHADDDVARLRALDDAVLARDDGFGLRRRLHHADGALDLGGHRLGRGGQRGAARLPDLSFAGIDVVHDEREAVLDEVQRHRSTHVPEPDESHRVGHRGHASFLGSGLTIRHQPSAGVVPGCRIPPANSSNSSSTRTERSDRCSCLRCRPS